MSHKKRREQFLKQKERERMRQEPMLPPEVPSVSPYDFGLLQQPDNSSSTLDDLVEQQRRTADLLAIGQFQFISNDVRARMEANRQALAATPTSTIWQTQAMLGPVMQELQYRELYQIHKALGGVYLP